MAFVYSFTPNITGKIATAAATACLIVLIQKHFKQ
jgi:hypothetical protein